MKQRFLPASAERIEPVKPGDTIVAAMGALISLTAALAPADDASWDRQEQPAETRGVAR